jgi:preprotein translocase subunit SecF
MNYKAEMIIPVALIIFSVFYIIYLASGPGLNMDIDFKGGTQITAQFQNPTTDIAKLEDVLKPYSANVRASMTGSSVFITFASDIDQQDVLSTIKSAGFAVKDYSVQTVGAALGTAFLQQAMFVIGFAFIFMAVVVFVIFRTPLPSFYVVLCGFADIIETLVFSQLLGIQLSLATFTSLLLLMGYSVDTDILLTTRVFKAETGNAKDNTKGAMKTGITMIGATMAALIALFIISTSAVISQIASVLLIGLILDIMNTWFLNAPLLRWFMERKKK